MIITTDLELIKLVTVKDSEYFINRPVSCLHYYFILTVNQYNILYIYIIYNMYLQEMINFSKKGERNLFVARDEEWKIARQTLSPSFSSLKLKAVSDQCRYLSCR